MRACLLILAASAVVGCRATEPTQVDPTPKGDRRFGIHITMASDNDYGKAFTAARATSMNMIAFGLSWTDVEKPSGWDTSLLDIANVFFGPQGLPIYFTITSPINTIVPEVPAAVQGLPYDDPRMIAGFSRFLDTLRAHTANLRIEVLVIGNEIDGLLGSDPAAWGRYQTFFEAARGRAKQLWGPTLSVGTTITRDGLSLAPVAAAIDRLIAASDLASITYYPLAADFSVRAPTVASADIDGVVARIAAKPIYFQEIGYQTSATSGSSEELQRQFAEEVFRAWDRHVDRIKYLGWLWLTDLSAEQTAELLRYYGVENSPATAQFGEYLRTLGIRRHDGVAKPGYTAIQSLLRARGW